MVVALQFGASASAFTAFGRPSLVSDDHAVHHRNLRILGIWEIGKRIIGKFREILRWPRKVQRHCATAVAWVDAEHFPVGF